MHSVEKDIQPKPLRNTTTEEVRKAADSFCLSPKNLLRQTKDDEQYYRQQFDHVNKLCESLRAKVKELETALKKNDLTTTIFEHSFRVLNVSLTHINCMGHTKSYFATNLIDIVTITTDIIKVTINKTSPKAINA
ncbi:hypothetical protein INT45_004350 [Circinella minor]|uniref:Uncharacterized protein n=1 Tax=Circinella minor TaxID=1195481 RepID=A0A8H7VUC0_9FUNG|nr:hypothetical protein INT45_004350 [Circinella minor]